MAGKTVSELTAQHVQVIPTHPLPPSAPRLPLVTRVTLSTQNGAPCAIKNRGDKRRDSKDQSHPSRASALAITSHTCAYVV